MSRVVSYRVEQRLAHLEDRTIEHERVGALVGDQLTDCVRVAGGDDFVPTVTQGEGQQLSNLWRVVDEQNASRCVHFLPEPVPGRRFFLPAAGWRSSTQTRPPAM